MKKTIKKLTLSRNTIRALSVPELREERVVGGWSQIQTCSICKPPFGFGCCSSGLEGGGQELA